MVKVVKTVRVPVHYAVTGLKTSILDRLTARLSFGVSTWSQIFEQNGLRGTYGERDTFSDDVRSRTGLPAAMVQCCYDTTKWMWSGYREQHREWRGKVAEAKKRNSTKWLEKLLQREPQKPFANGMQHKVPVWFDRRTGAIEQSRNIALAPWVARISTLKNGEMITIPLNPAKYHSDLLVKGKLKSFQLVKRDGRYHVHVKIEYDVPDQPVRAVRGTDLGIKRTVSIVTLRLDRPRHPTDFEIIADGEKRQRLNRLNSRIAELQEAGKWEPLKRLRHKRRNMAEYYDRLAAKRVADGSNESLVVVGYPKGIKYSGHRGNGNRSLRKKLAGWAYGRAIRYIREECAERGIRTEAPLEWWSSRTCPHCHSRHTERPTQSLLHCWDCELWYNADYAAGINLGSPFLPLATVRRGADDSPQDGEDQAREIVACEPARSPRTSAVGEVTQIQPRLVGPARAQSEKPLIRAGVGVGRELGVWKAERPST